MMAMNRTTSLALAIAFALLPLWSSCRSPDEGKSPPGASRYSVKNASGNYDLYLGPNIADRASHSSAGGGLEKAAYFIVGNVPATLIEAARAKPNRVVSLAVETPRASPLALVVNHLVGEQVKTLSVKTGDPSITGTVQIWIDEQGTPVGLFELNVWHRAADGSMSSDIYSTGLAPDPDRPPTGNPR
jgi:hypothetical protein